MNEAQNFLEAMDVEKNKSKLSMVSAFIKAGDFGEQSVARMFDRLGFRADSFDIKKAMRILKYV